MIVCICNNIRSTDLKQNPELANLIGSCCGRCMQSTNNQSANQSTTKKE